MKLFRFFRRKKKHEPVIFEEETVDVRFNLLADFVKELGSRADYNKAVGAMEDIFSAYQKLRGIKVEEDTNPEGKFELHEDER